MAYEQTDPATGLPVLTKQPASTRTFRMDFTAATLYTGIASVQSAVAVNQNLVGGSGEVTVESAELDDAQVVLRLSGGTDLENYKITITVLDDNGDPIEGDGMLYVRER